MDPISDMLSHIRNAGAAKKQSVRFPYSKIKNDIAKILAKNGYVARVGTIGKKQNKLLEVELAYTKEGAPKIIGSRRVSKPSCRIYQGFREIRPLRRGHGMIVVTTPKGILSDTDARKAKVGGEVLFTIW
ncbi:MAG: 30S ribosomal protein S8 [Candidatus Lloydbacteria bacterium CG22_combo_CG10-13_8_21_14_all_47_15]|uniref:Small ribosomal subunit protein uS8 n=1 Tax=Candidatus Lloydbacteria bacterium CG22_combo_CG10-13_8_21_14_all_47_15 TaxID=1974635 RepID=A0A2H0CTS8_9BACT|nr:MAG: 30S ribosomal protein S8 [Candidatus Lloydbacteria bacterium CG22_combo_CG10-13_8_21_14_all_47_15]